MASDSRIWAITTYFNPNSYVSRRNNYKTFRQFLGLPLCTIEHSISGTFELDSNDADVLVQISSPDTLWQKERLLNVVHHYLPDNADIVAWIDCDVVFAKTDWFHAIPSLLQTYSVVQCYSELVDLSYHQSLSFSQMSVSPTSRLSIAYIIQQRQLAAKPPLDVYDVMRRGCPGGAWAATRRFFEQYGLYDFMVLGGGDRVFAYACTGDIDEAAAIARFSDARATHYRSWATRVHSETGGRVAVIEGQLFHLWHGALSKRRYLGRHEELYRLSFEPMRDLTPSMSGAWQWSDAASMELRSTVRSYFEERTEDENA